MAGARSFGKRLAAFLLALLFLGTTIGFTVAVIFQIRKDNQTAQTEMTEPSPTGPKLAGTKLADFTPSPKVEALQTIDLTLGSGIEANAASVVTAHYTGALARDGTIFESSHEGDGQPFTSSLDAVIEGWRLGIPGMKVGGKRRLIIPASLAYGEQSPSPRIPPGSDLVFDIELLAAEPPPAP